ncbi:MAG TPA: ferritin [Gallionellaceae bacterium]|nr:ferritin [Gallionellaceae bacterium]
MSDSDQYGSSNELSAAVCNMHTAIVSLTEELTAIDLYNQRADVCKDKELKKILIHNRDDEKEHASMLLEWIQRNDPKFSGEMTDSLFTKKSITKR